MSKDIPKITYVSRFVKTVIGIIEKTKNRENSQLYFRGHANCEWKSMPSLCRLNLGLSEHKMYRDFVAKYDSEFLSCTSAIDALSKMQHYELPTRLLDVTTNMLVALYFACLEDDKSKDKDGEVLMYLVPQTYVKYFDSDTVTIVSNLAKSDIEEIPLSNLTDKHFIGDNLPTEHKAVYTKIELCAYIAAILPSLRRGEKSSAGTPSPDQLHKRIIALIDQHNEIVEDSQCIKREDIQNLKLKQKDTARKSLEELRSRLVSSIQEPLSINFNALQEESDCVLIERFNEGSSASYLLHQAKADKPYLQDIIDPSDLGKVWAVKSKKNNQRLINQSGEFLLFGLGVDSSKLEEGLFLTKKTCATFPQDWLIASEHNQQRLIISSDKKKSILNELDYLGINKSFIFPEMSSFAEEIKQKYQ